MQVSDIQSTAEAFARTRSERDRDACVWAGHAYVRSVAARTPVPDSVCTISQEDLVQAGWLGYLRALDLYNPERGTPFVSFAYGAVRGEVVNEMRRVDVLSRVERGLDAQVRKTAQDAEQRLGRHLSIEELAAEAGLTEKRLVALMRHARARAAKVITSGLSKEGEVDLGCISEDILGAADPAFDQMETEQDLALAQRLMGELLSSRDRSMLLRHAGGDTTIDVIAEEAGLTTARIYQIVSGARKTIRRAFDAVA